MPRRREIFRPSRWIRTRRRGPTGGPHPLLRRPGGGMGVDGNSITLSADVVTSNPPAETFQAEASGGTLTGGADGAWRTDLTTMPRINRAARDWSQSYCAALKSYGIDVAAAFSMELQH